ncbi:MAG: protein translocase subunit SecD, partial [Candidatus Omnitrophica bacterium]|nr:protein translocase subunit SecD [Candidatus Omnitrophota bacterium]
MIKKADLKIRLIIIAASIALSIFYIFPLKKNISLGLDLKGGMYILLKADTASISPSKISDAIS